MVRWPIRIKLMVGLSVVVGMMLILMGGSIFGLHSFHVSNLTLTDQLRELGASKDLIECVLRLHPPDETERPRRPTCCSQTARRAQAGLVELLPRAEAEHDAGQSGQQRLRRAGARLPARRRPDGDHQRPQPPTRRPPDSAGDDVLRHPASRTGGSPVAATSDPDADSPTIRDDSAPRSGDRRCDADRSAQAHGHAASQGAARRLLRRARDVEDAVPDQPGDRLDLGPDGAGDALRADRAVPSLGALPGPAAPARGASGGPRVVRLQDRPELRRRDAGPGRGLQRHDGADQR